MRPTDNRAGRPSARARTRAAAAMLASLGALALLPGAAQAKIIELGKTASEPTPSCPAKPCLAISRTTGYQAKVGEDRGLFAAPQAGRVVAWTITLAKPTKKQIAFFNQTLGGAPSAGITVIRPSERLFAKVTGQSPVERLTPYLGESVQFPLERSLKVRKGDVVALTVPTWAPALAVGFGNDTSWRASRAKGKCDDTSTQTSVQTVGQEKQFRCLYRTAQITYSVTMITSPKPAKKKRRSSRR